ncbi:MAG: DUF3726 domain-containing protein [Paracoccaceae bacterium]
MTTAPIDMALSELRALVTKAARGAGLGWGHAEEAGWAAEWLARHGLPAADWATLWLARCVAGGEGPVTIGAALADRLAPEGGPLPQDALPDYLPAPGYLLPFLHLIARARGAIAIRAGGIAVATVDPDGGVTFGPGWAQASAGWSIAPATEPPTTDAPTTTRALVSASVIDCLDGLALRTTVPPSDASRRNAGAASSDND